MINLTVSNILEHSYCPGFTWFELVLGIPQYEEKYHKVLLGREVHEKKEEINKDYLRKRIGVTKKWIGCYLSYNHLRGIVDEVLELSDGTMAPLDYKFTEWNDYLYSAIKIQLRCYAYLIENTFKKNVTKGYVVFVRSKNYLVEEPISEKDKDNIDRIINEIIEIINTNHTPLIKRVINKCNQCTYRKLCYL